MANHLDDRSLLAQELLDSSPDLVLVVHQDLTLMYINRSGCEFYATSSQNAVGRKCYELYTRSEPCLSCPVLELQETDVPQIEKEIFRSGKGIWHNVRAWRLNEQFVTSCKDITDRKSYERQLPDLGKRLQLFVDRLPFGCILWDEEFKVATWNSAAEKIFGYSRKEAMGRHPYGMIVSQEQTKETEPVKKRLTAGDDTAHREGPNITKDGTAIYCSWLNTPLQDSEGKFQGVLSIVQDISEKKQQQERMARSAKLASIGELAANVAHEINNPISGVISYSELLLNQVELNDQQRDIVQRTIKEGERIASIVRRLLGFAREAGSEKTYIDIQEVIEDAMALLKVQFAKEKVCVSTSPREDIPPVFCNPQQIEQVVLNILQNAWHALLENPLHDRKISIDYQMLPREGKRLLAVHIANNGPPISPANTERIFEPFVTTKPVGLGTGLGLSISRDILLDHEGELTVSSDAANGTVFTLCLPLP